MYYSIYYLPPAFLSKHSNVSCSFCIVTAKGFYYIRTLDELERNLPSADLQTFISYGRPVDYAVSTEGTLLATFNSYSEFLAEYPELFI